MVRASAEKVKLNPGNKPNDAQTRKSYLSLYSVQKTKQRKIDGTF